MDTTIPTWGYKPDGSAQIFDLAPGAGLPEGWSASPSVITDPALATGEALTVRALGRDFAPHGAGPAEDAPVVDGDALSHALGEIERLNGIIAAGTAENEKLGAELDAADALHEQGAKALEALTAERDVLKAEAEATAADIASLREQLAAAQAERDAAKAAHEEVKADLDAATAPAPAPEKPAKAAK